MTVSASSSPLHKKTRMQNTDQIYRLIDRALATRYARQLIRPNATQIRQSQSTPVLRPRMELCDSSDSPNLTATLELPGMKKEEISIEVQNGCLTISGDRQPPEPQAVASGGVRFPVQELKYGPFRRVIPLPRGVEANQISANMHDGLLVVSWPRAGAAEEPQRIQVG